MKEALKECCISIFFVLLLSFQLYAVEIQVGNNSFEGIVIHGTVYIQVQHLNVIDNVKIAIFPTTHNININVEYPETDELKNIKCAAGRKEVNVNSELFEASRAPENIDGVYYVPASYVETYMGFPVKLKTDVQDVISLDDVEPVDTSILIDSQEVMLLKNVHCFAETGGTLFCLVFSKNIFLEDYEIDENSVLAQLAVLIQGCELALDSKNSFTTELVSNTVFKSSEDHSIFVINLKEMGEYKIKIEKNIMNIIIGNVSEDAIYQATQMIQEKEKNAASVQSDVVVDATVKKILETRTQDWLFHEIPHDTFEIDIDDLQPNDHSYVKEYEQQDIQYNDTEEIISDTVEIISVSEIKDNNADITDDTMEKTVDDTADTSDQFNTDTAEQHLQVKTEKIDELRLYRSSANIKDHIIVLDPGHGQGDPGISIPEFTEENFCYLFCERLAEFLRETGFTVYLSRNEYSDPSDIMRAQFAASQKADLFISVHLAASFSEHMSGIEVYTHTFKNEPQTKAQQQQRVVSSFSVQQRKRAHIYAQHLISVLQKNSVHVNDLTKIPVNILKYSAVPSLLIELGYVSSIRDKKNLTDEKYRDQLAEILAHGIIKIFEKQ